MPLRRVPRVRPFSGLPTADRVNLPTPSIEDEHRQPRPLSYAMNPGCPLIAAYRNVLPTGTTLRMIPSTNSRPAPPRAAA